MTKFSQRAAAPVRLSAVTSRSALTVFMNDPNGATAAKKDAFVPLDDVAGYWDVSSFGVVSDGVTDQTAALNAAIEWVADAGGGFLYLRTPTPSLAIRIDGSVKVLSGVTLVGVNRVKRGARGRIGIMGTLDEGTARYELRAASSGSTIQLETGAAATIPVGSRIVLRGENDAGGDTLLEPYRGTVLANGSNNLTVDPPLPYTFEVSYPSSAYQGGNDKSLLSVVAQSALSVDAPAGATSVTVATGSALSGATQVTLEDDLTGADISGSSDNQVNMETNWLTARDGNTATLGFGLAHGYSAGGSPAFNGRVSLMNAVVDARVVNVVVEWAEAEDDDNRYAFFAQFARGGGFFGCVAKGDPATGLGPRSQSFRVGEGCLDVRVEGNRVEWPASFGSGQGYGCAVYAGARGTQVRGNTFIGCRHSVVIFKGAADTLVEGNASFDCRISDYDCHGAGETGALFVGNLAVGGPSTDGESPPSAKAAFKVGNPTHRYGGHQIAFSGNWARSYPGEVLHVIAGSSDVVWDGGGGIDCDGGVKIEGTAGATGIAARRISVRGMTLHGCGSAVVVDGVDSGIQVENVIVGGLVLTDPPAATLVNCDWVNGLALPGLEIQRAAVGSVNYLADIRNVTGLEGHGWRLDGGRRALFLDTCPDARLSGWRLSGLLERIVLGDGGGNAGSRLLDYDMLDADPAFSGNGSAILRIPTRLAEASAASDDSGGTTYTGTGSPPGPTLPFDDTTPQIAEVITPAVMSATIRPKIPRGRIHFSAAIDYASISSADVAALVVFYKIGAGADVFAGIGVARLTSGANSGGEILAQGFIDHAEDDLSQDFTFSAYIGLADPAKTLTIESRFGTVPTLRVWERPASV